MLTIFKQFFIFVSHNQFLLIAAIFSLSLKSFLLFSLSINSLRSNKIQKSLFYLLGVLASAMIDDFAWVSVITRRMFFYTSDPSLVLFFVRIAWGFQLIQFQSLSIFLESLIGVNYYKNFFKKLLVTISIIPSIYFLYISIAQYPNIINRTYLEFFTIKFIIIYKFFLVIPSLYLVITKLQSKNFPKILGKQLKVFIYYFTLPSLFIQLIQTNPFFLSVGYLADSTALVSLSTIFMTFTIYFCTKKIMHLRFLNFSKHVQSYKKFNFFNNFKEALEQFSRINNLNELGYLTRNFFKEAFEIPINKSKLYLIQSESNKSQEDYDQENIKIKKTVEDYLRINHLITEELKKLKIFIYDEIEFSNYYENKENNKIILKFLDAINAEIFLPVYQNNRISAYIIIEKNSRQDVYSNLERDEMEVFASYISYIIKLHKNRTLNILIQQEKNLKEELYSKYQKINLYKECIKYFFNKPEEREIGILYYKNRKFIYINQTAKKLIGINLNEQDGHPLAQEIRKIIMQVKEYNTPQKNYVKNIEGKKIILNGIPNLEQNNIIITVYYPEISDIIKNQIQYLKNPNKWDMLLYLELTKFGQLINQFIPSSGETLLNFKIYLLETAINKKPILLTMPNEDLLSIVEIIHHINHKEKLHILKLEPGTNILNKIFESENPNEQPILEKLNKIGTLFIENIHFLNIENQNQLADFIKTGFFKNTHSDRLIQSDVRIICSTNQNLQLLSQENKFSNSLYNELRQNTLFMPSLITLPEEELIDLIKGIADYLLQKETFKKLLDLNNRDINKITKMKLGSIAALKSKIQHTLIKKSKNNKMEKTNIFKPTENIIDLELAEISKLGKHALKDQKIMLTLWEKFKNQSKIAKFLGVNRSSVNRRCKDYNLY